MIRRVAHLIGCVQGPLHLLFQCTGTRIPEEFFQEGHIPQGWCGPGYLLAANPARARQSVTESALRIVAIGTGHGTIRGEHRVEKQITAQVDLLRGKPVPVRRQRCLRSTQSRALHRIVEVIHCAQGAVAALGLFEAGRAVITQHNIRRPNAGSTGEQEQRCGYPPECAR